ncbi:DUF3080 family protein [Zhongshania aquimaris]|uniref:DUF3080 domain-containing protein n=1 Tax=Zhongshania aquimaris TaxID=2857107 RepID=A0ABS6VNU4_9GAMM|nr:DUF3080 family protein [Zhongshania aquimaris]MBW2939704.1 DUF3080 domain-containing protein [Zhongshania aquimaris]
MFSYRQPFWKYVAAIAFCLPLFLSGCSDSSELENHWRDYLTRLARVLDREASASPQEASLHFPRPRDIAITFADSNIDLLDFLRMRQCALRETIAERNSILGRHGDASAKLIFDLRFLSEAETCIDILHSEGKASLAATLREAANLKQRELPNRLFAAGIAGAEFREFWQAPPDLRSYHPDRGDDPSIAALARWNRWQQQWLAGNWQHDTDEILSTLGKIRLGDGGALLKAQQLNTAKLKAAADIIEQRLVGRPLCLKASPTPAANQFRNVLSSYFITQIQQQASLINRHQFAILSEMTPIENELLAAMRANELPVPTAYLDWLKKRSELLDKATDAQRQHVERAGALLSQCGLAPGT